MTHNGPISAPANRYGAIDTDRAGATDRSTSGAGWELRPTRRSDPYFYDRAEAELDRAQRADHPDAAKAHYVLAGLYLDRFYGEPGGGVDGLGLTADDQHLPGDGVRFLLFPGDNR